MFSNEDREVFPYSDGTAEVWGDPLEIQRKMNAALDGDVNGVVELSHDWHEQPDDQGNLKLVRKNPPKIAAENSERLVAAIREAFSLSPFDRATGQGCTSAMCMTVWNAFCDWQAALKKKQGS